MGPMEARRHVESRSVDAAGESEGSVAVFVGLNTGEKDAEGNCICKALDQSLTVAFAQSMVGPRYCHAREQQDQSIQQG